ncbi:metal ABC transporter solute-binding protein, Zn/Mn family [Microbacterium sp. NPDC091313]
MTRRAIPLAALAAASVLALAGCAGTAAGQRASDSADTFTIVTSTNVYAQIVQEIAGDGVSVEAVISSAAQDPHDYEATAADQLTVQQADLIIENGGGYDGFMDSLISASGSSAPVIVAAEYSDSWPGTEADEHTTDELQESPHAEEEHTHAEDAEGHEHIEGFNEHVWYDPHTVEHVADAIAQELTALRPDRADQIASNLDAFTGGLAELETSLGDIGASHQGEKVFVTEPVPGYLVAAAGLDNATPSEFSEAVEEGQDVPPATLLEAVNLLKGGTVKVLIANAQAGGAETDTVIATAKDNDIPVLEFTETIPDGQTYLQWMTQNIEDLAGALNP